MTIPHLKDLLASATCTLLATSPGAYAEDPHPVGEWDISSALLLYSESDRVRAVEPVINANKALDTDESINIKLTVDTLTGASASGAVPSTQPQTFTRPSGDGSYVTGARSIPLDDTFLDSRAALALTWSRPAFQETQSELGFNISKEYDYLSIGTSASIAKNLNDNNTTVTTGFSLARDTIDPVGGAPVPFALMQPQGVAPIRESGSQSKTLVDLIAGVTQVIDENSLFQINYSFGRSNGYLNDPYKFVSVVDPINGAPVFDNALDASLPRVVFENRPDSRTKHGLYGQYKRFIQSSGDILDATYRFTVDDWGINSHTIDLKYRKLLSNGKFLQPHIRWYQQDAADFYTPFLVSGEEPQSGDTSSLASADYRIGEFTGYTIGLEYGQVNPHNSWSVALEYYLQTGDEPAGKFGELETLELYPDVDAVLLRVLYDF
ncbi:hypothetical protein AB833_01930 [Chromatiales bacterium (ex Bugula neritina AB1)]|nr:hypothetical protein AB833_01930 [Chromatiales bacterium (ex Bugula neritina AB1)]